MVIPKIRVFCEEWLIFMYGGKRVKGHKTASSQTLEIVHFVQEIVHF